jgi:hypothetical protein
MKAEKEHQAEEARGTVDDVDELTRRCALIAWLKQT